jgi:hypothetical protein
LKENFCCFENAFWKRIPVALRKHFGREFLLLLHFGRELLLLWKALWKRIPVALRLHFGSELLLLCECIMEENSYCFERSGYDSNFNSF